MHVARNEIDMRKKKKQEILEILKTIDAAHETAKRVIDRGSIAEAQDILVQCQQKAIEIGTSIEQLEGEGSRAVSCLEEYCEVAFAAFEELNKADFSANRIYKLLRKQLIKAENSIKNDICVRKEVAFFPYKASMWDSLESVYLAAKSDPECDAYCVPIPYFNLKPDRGLGAMHYEGGEYPKDIEITDWQSYDFENRMPDEIYIHNAYDDFNLVTRIHPRFYSANLKKYTDMLIYIPYFVLGEIEPDNQAAIDSMKHFIWLPGVVNADKVIVQSEKMKQIYVNEYLKAAKNNGLGGRHLDRKYLESKIIGAGSPKLDRVQRIKKEDLEIPQEWLEIIRKDDGTYKKIIFYNTSIGALLEHDSKMLEKMERVFEIFKEYREDVALLWRPHPLIQSTIQAMRPRLWEKYSEIVEKYRREGWGIYDDSTDIDRAVVISDAYYGDGSSVVELCKKKEIPIMIQNVDI